MKVSKRHEKTPRTHKGFAKGKNGDQVKHLGPITIEEIMAEAPQYSKKDATIREMVLRTEPTNEQSPILKRKFKPLDNPTRVLEVLQGLHTIKEGVIGNNVTTGPLQYSYWRGCLTGTALRKFEEFSANVGTETTGHLIQVEQLLVKFFAPQEVLQQQKRYIRHNMRKPSGHNTRQYVGAVHTLNGKLQDLPPNYTEDQKISNNDLLDVLAAQAPKKHKEMLTDHGFDPTTETVDKFIELCERAEIKEEISSGASSRHKTRFESDDSDDSTPAYKRNKSSKKTYRTSRSPHYCKEHGPNNTHGTRECKTLLAKNGDKKPEWQKEKRLYKDYKSKYTKKSKELNLLQLEAAQEKSKWTKMYKKLKKASNPSANAEAKSDDDTSEDEAKNNEPQQKRTFTPREDLTQDQEDTSSAPSSESSMDSE